MKINGSIARKGKNYWMSDRTRRSYTVETYTDVRGALAAARRYDAKLPDADFGPPKWIRVVVRHEGGRYRMTHNS